jgi:hypothetical protein
MNMQKTGRSNESDPFVPDPGIVGISLHDGGLY